MFVYLTSTRQRNVFQYSTQIAWIQFYALELFVELGVTIQAQYILFVTFQGKLT